MTGKRYRNSIRSWLGYVAMMSERRTRPARLEDVARESGVHVSTVSRVLNGSRLADGAARDP